MTFILIFKNLFEIAVSDSLSKRFCSRKFPSKEIKNKFIFTTDLFLKEFQREVPLLLSAHGIFYRFFSPPETLRIFFRKYHSFHTSWYTFFIEKETEREALLLPSLRSQYLVSFHFS